MALSGLVVIISYTYFGHQVYLQSQTLRGAYIRTQSEYLAYITLRDKERDELDRDAQMKLEEANIDVVRAKIGADYRESAGDDALSSVKALVKFNRETENALEVMKARADELNFMLKLKDDDLKILRLGDVLATVFGALLLILGFGFWYIKSQRPTDELLRMELATKRVIFLRREN